MGKNITITTTVWKEFGNSLRYVRELSWTNHTVAMFHSMGSEVAEDGTLYFILQSQVVGFHCWMSAKVAKFSLYPYTSEPSVASLLLN